ESMDGRGFLGVGGAALICTIGGKRFKVGKNTDAATLSRQKPVPPKGNGARNNPPAPNAQVTANRRESSVRIDEMTGNSAPKKRDQMMNASLKKEGRSTLSAYGCRAWTPNFGQPLTKKPTIPGPLLDATVGDTLVVHFRNLLPAPVTMHPHGA